MLPIHCPASRIALLSCVVCLLVWLPWAVLADVVCLNDWDCSLGGVCNQQTAQCDCDVWWTGPTCAQLNLQPASRVNGFNLAVNTTTWSALPANTATHTWCTSVHYDDSTHDYFAAVSYITNHCTLDAWTTNSEVVTVRSKSPFGPFDPSSMTVLVQPFAHNPKVVRYVDGTWLLFFIGAIDGSITPNNCSSASPHSASAPASASHSSSPYFSDFDAAPSVRHPTVDPGNDGARVAWSNSSLGPWTLYNEGAPVFGPNSTVWYSNCVTNPAPVILPNGTVLLYFTANPDALRGPHSGNTMAVARAPHWAGPYTNVDEFGGVTAPDAEDPFVFRDPRGHFHMLMNTNTGHWMGGNLTGLYTGHSWSEGRAGVESAVSGRGHHHRPLRRRIHYGILVP